MKIVLDSSVGLKWLLFEQHTDRALRLRDEYIRNTHALPVPDVFPIEVAHALARAERRGLLKSPEGSEKLRDLLAILPPLYSTLPLLPRAFEIASDARIGVYDCLYVALAEEEHCALVTADQRLLNTLATDFPCLVDLASLPP